MLVECSARGFLLRNNPRYTQIAFIRRFWRKLGVISLPFDIFRRLNALFTALYLWNAVHAVSSVEVSPDTHKSRHSPILSKIKRCFSPISDNSTFKRSFHCIMLLECIARVSQRRNKRIYTQIVIIRRFWRKLCVVSLPFEIFLRLNALFTALCFWNVLHAVSSVETSAYTRKS